MSPLAQTLAEVMYPFLDLDINTAEEVYSPDSAGATEGKHVRNRCGSAPALRTHDDGVEQGGVQKQV